MPLYSVSQRTCNTMIQYDLILIKTTEEKHAASMGSKVAKWLLDV